MPAEIVNQRIAFVAVFAKSYSIVSRIPIGGSDPDFIWNIHFGTVTRLTLGYGESADDDAAARNV